MKLIWLISPSFDGVMAGPSIRFQRYAPLFAARGYRLQFVTLRLSETLPAFESREHFDVYRVEVRFRPFARTRFISRALFLILRKGGRRSNVLSFGFQTYQLWIIPWLKFVFGFKLFYINTMAAHAHFWPGRGAAVQAWNHVHRRLYRILYRLIDGVVCSTADLSEQMRPLGLRKDKTFIINNGVDTLRFRPLPPEEKTALRKEMGLSQDALLFLFVGLKTERKGIRELCDAWAKIVAPDNPHNAQLLLVGDEKEEANSPVFNQWWQTYKRHTPPPSIHILPGTRNIAPWFQAADVFVFPSKKEGMPNVLLEAMACGLPVIMNRFEGYSEDYGHPKQTHFLFEHRPDNQLLEEALATCWSNPQVRESIGHRARGYALQHFSVEHSVEKFIHLFNRNR